MRNPRLYPRLWDACYLSLTDLRVGIAQVAPVIKGKVIDFGSGSKPYQELFANVESYRGVDFIIHDAKDILLKNPDCLPMPNESVDNVLSFQVLEHVQKPQQYLRECHRVLKPGGRLLLTTHGTWCYHPGPNNGDFWRWTHDGLENIFQECGFAVERKEGLTHGSRCLMQMLLILQDPFRHRQTRLRGMGLRLCSLAINAFAVIVHPLFKAVDARMDIIPIGYLILGRKI
jgi:SAM-dependent methyltransferase